MLVLNIKVIDFSLVQSEQELSSDRPKLDKTAEKQRNVATLLLHTQASRDLSAIFFESLQSRAKVE